MKNNATTGTIRQRAIGETARRGAYRSGLFAVLLSAAIGVAGLPVHAGVIGAPDVVQKETPIKTALAKPRSSLQLLKAQMNAFKDSLDNLNQLKQFFEQDSPGREEILRDAQTLIQTLPQTENAGDAAWRIAAVASLATSAGQLSSLRISDDFNLTGGAVGWDFGASDAPVQHGFTPVTPESLRLDGVEGDITAVNGATALTDGINAPANFRTSLPNGMYRILIVADPAVDDGEGRNPFGNGITINDASIGAGDMAGKAPRTQRSLGTEAGDKVAGIVNPTIRKTAQGLGIEGWVIVRDGRLEIDFQGLPQDRTISAIVAEPIDLNKMELNPTIADALAAAFSGLEPAAGPDAPRGGFAPLGPGNSSGTSQASAGASRKTVPPPAVRNTPAPTTRAPFISSFGNRRQQVASSVAPAALQLSEAPEPAVETPVVDTDDFFDRQVLVKQGDGDDNSQGVAIDLGNLLDNGSGTGTFLCDEAPCEDTNFTEITTEPDLSAADALLDDWLSDAANLEHWDEIAAVLANWAPGSEIALVYEFDIADDLWTDVEFRANAGNGILIWIDGVFVHGASGPGTFTDQAGYDYRAEFPDLAGGSHVLQIIVESRNGETPTLNFELRGTPVASNTASVPEPAAMALFGLGLAGLFAIRRRKTQA
ncbi:MAG: PEP-CTERM sorting domain-containing protein [Alphaproteobacteria bacterium]